MNKLPFKLSTIISTKLLADTITSRHQNYRLLDASWHMPDAKRYPRIEFNKHHIPTAQFFDIDDCCDKASPYGHMLPPANQFEEYVGSLGISNDSHVIVYDTNEACGLFSAQRVWWTFRVFGHDQVSIVAGGYPKWIKEQREVTSVVEDVTQAKFTANYKPHMVKKYEDMKLNIEKKEYAVFDARGPGRFNGIEPEPREGISSGHIPGATNLPYRSLVDLETQTGLLHPDVLKTRLADVGLDLDKPVVATCGSGISACHIALAAYMCGKEDVAVYDGSWTEWYLRSAPEDRVSYSLDYQENLHKSIRGQLTV